MSWCLPADDITEADGNYVEYQTAPSGAWHPSRFCVTAVKRLLNTQYSDYMSNVRKADCEADLKRRLAKGPPIWLEDKHGLPLPDEDTHVCRIWMAVDGEYSEYSAKLRGCVEGEERMALWEELKKFAPPAGTTEAVGANEPAAADPPAAE